ncbi:PA2779 family protein [Thiohalorhabdus methylotrophus]|uniref:PA2779 family protein n=1 Tax=Thiohalorhabdus methylotrophus TaxID=3242694 RepID=A0ABV4TTY8_9GAMM
MQRVEKLGPVLAMPLAVLVVLLSMPMGVVKAGLVSTEQVVKDARLVEKRARVQAFLARSDVRQQLERWGVSPKEASSRVDSLTDSEVRRLAGALEREPAGGDALGTLVGGAIFVFILLLITDIAGLTDVFPFVKKP